MPTKIYEFYEDTQDILNLIDTKYVFFAHNHYDFDRIEANFERMIREAENQNADIVTGKSFKVNKNSSFRLNIKLKALQYRKFESNKKSKRIIFENF